jgi:hypothetical protein
MVERDGIAKPVKLQGFTGQGASGLPLNRSTRLRGMPKTPVDTIVRTPFGERLFTARTRVTPPMSQRALGDLVGLSQSTINELEKTGQGSTKTARIAEVTGVRWQWLERGELPMLDTTELPNAARQVAGEAVVPYLVGKPASQDYRTVALSLAASLEESGVELSVKQFIQLLEGTYEKLQRG